MRWNLNIGEILRQRLICRALPDTASGYVCAAIPVIVVGSILGADPTVVIGLAMGIVSGFWVQSLSL